MLLLLGRIAVFAAMEIGVLVWVVRGLRSGDLYQGYDIIRGVEVRVSRAEDPGGFRFAIAVLIGWMIFMALFFFSRDLAGIAGL